jgi:hypothetical protein
VHVPFPVRSVLFNTDAGQCESTAGDLRARKKMKEKKEAVSKMLEK